MECNSKKANSTVINSYGRDTIPKYVAKGLSVDVYPEAFGLESKLKTVESDIPTPV